MQSFVKIKPSRIFPNLQYNRNYGMVYNTSKWPSDFAILSRVSFSRNFAYFRENKPSRKLPNLQCMQSIDSLLLGVATSPTDTAFAGL